MCGILGGNIQSWNYTGAIDCIRHRGPDGTRIEAYPHITFAFCRLAIQDLSDRAMQPMSSPDNKVHIIFNGEIYGYQILKRELAKKYHFVTLSDTEVILYAYMEYGDQFIDKIDGIFALAVYDERVQRIYLYRDRVGVKPLYYFFDGKQFAFASELKALECLLNNVRLKVDKTAIFDYLFYRYIPEPKSMYHNIFKLRPATKMVFDVSSSHIVEKKLYWKLNINTHVERKRSKEDLARELQILLRKTIKEQLVSDVPIGTFLSGGVDSSIITYEIQRFIPEVTAFSIGFKEAQFDESERAKLLCQNTNISLKNKILSSNQIKHIKNQLASWYDEPFGDTSAYPTYLVSKFAKEYCTVVLTGDGGDELFGGYNWYEYLFTLGNKVKMEDVYYQYAKPAYTVEDFKNKWDIPKDYDPYWHYNEYYVQDMPIITRMRYLDFMTFLPESVLTKVDRTSMAVSLEARVPFLARRMIEFAFSLSQEEYFSDHELKGCLKDAYKGIISDEILYGVKMGFCVPSNYLWKERHESNINAGILKNEWRELERSMASGEC